MNAYRRIVGWREWICIPSFGNLVLEAKISTGIIDSVCYSCSYSLFERDGENWVAFDMGFNGGNATNAVLYEARVTRIKQVPDDGNLCCQPVITTNIVLGENVTEIDLVIIRAKVRSFRIVLGQLFLRNRYIVDSSLSFKNGYPQI